jgi:hypothetical protein
LQHKAGMDGCDMDEIARKVYELTKNDPHYKKQEFKTNRAKEKGQHKLKKISNYQNNSKLYRFKQNDAK